MIDRARPDAFVRAEAVLTRDVETALLLRSPRSPGVVSLSGSGPHIWHLLRAPVTVDELVTRLAEQFHVPAETIADDVHRTVQALVEARVVRRAA
ncbi:MAG: PqqD family protein [Actinomycetes bacterium]